MTRRIFISALLLAAAAPTLSAAPQDPAIEFRRQRMVDANGQIAPAAMRRARAERAANLDHWDNEDFGGGIGNYSWTERGADNMGGRTRALLVHPTITGRIYAGSVGGGVWRSDNSGATWYPLAEFMGNLAVASMAMDPVDPDVIYVGTGEGYGNHGAIRGDGIFRTDDAGATWTQLPGTEHFGAVNRLAIIPTNTDWVLAATATGLRLSDDGGQTWTARDHRDCYQVLLDPNHPLRLTAVWRTSDPTTYGIMRTTDAGVTWTDATPGYPAGQRIELAYSASVNQLMFASLGGGHCWRSTNGGQSWSSHSSNPIPGSDWHRSNVIWAHPTNANYLLIGNRDLYRSPNGGQAFFRLTDGRNDPDHPQDHFHAFAEDTNFASNGRLWTATAEGLWYANAVINIPSNHDWTARNDGYRVTQYYGVDGHVLGRLVGGAQDTGSHLIDSTSGMGAERIYGGHGTISLIDPTDENLFWGATPHLGVHQTWNGAQSVNFIATTLLDHATQCANFVAPLELSAINTNYLFAGGCSLWRCSNARSASPTWTAIRGPIGSRISAIGISPNSTNTVWIGYNDGRVYRTGNATAGTPSWITVDDNGALDPFPDRMITSILVDRVSVSRVMVGLGGFFAGNIRRTTNTGASWSDATGTWPTRVPAAPVYDLAQHPTLDGRYYAATELGIYGTSDHGASWSTTNAGPADVSCESVTFVRGTETLLVGTHGRGMWTTTITEPDGQPFGAGCVGTNGTPALSSTAPRIGETITFTGTNLVPERPVWLLQGWNNTSWFGNALPADLAPFQAPGCMLLVRPDVIRDGYSDAQGECDLDLPIGPFTALLGTRFYAQLFAGDLQANGFGMTSSNALNLRIGN